MKHIHFLLEHTFLLLAYLALSMGVTWPLTQNFTTAITGAGDAQHHLWILWHVKQALFGHDSLFHTSLLYYPDGTTLLTSALGPLTGGFALPFWLFGPEAAYNGALLVGFSLTGYTMYLLARDIGFDRGVAFFAGTVLLVAPIHLSALFGHLSKIFLGIPLVLLALHRVLDTKRSLWWTVLAALMMLLTLLQSGEQFVFSGLAVVFFVIVALLRAEPSAQRLVLKRSLMTAVITFILTGPLLISILTITNNSAISVDKNLESFNHQPDLAQFILPVEFSRFTGPLFRDILEPYNKSPIESAVFIAWTAQLLCLLSLISGQKMARNWFVFTVLCILIALGPNLKIFGRSQFTEYELPIIMPYAFITALPGFDFWRTPGRFMLVGFVGVGITASFGLTWLIEKLPAKSHHYVIIAVTALVLLETWPNPWPQERLRPVPKFYQELAQVKENFGVFDLPLRPYQDIGYDSWYVYYSSYYQMYQMTHGKGIASGYIDRPYNIHPFFGHVVSDTIADSPLQSDIYIDSKPANRYANMQFELSQNNYRYVVYHKPQDWYSDYKKGSYGEFTAKAFIKEVFGQQKPLVDDELVTVYEVEPITDVTKLTPTIALRESSWQNWIEYTTGVRRAISPATFYVASPYPQIASIEVTPRQILPHEFDKALLSVQSSNHFPISAEMRENETTILPLFLDAGSQVITMTLSSSDSDLALENPILEFEIEAINLATQKNFRSASDLLVDGQVISNTHHSVMAVHGSSWYEAEGPSWRWAMSPAELFVYSPLEQTIKLEMTPVFLNDPNNPGQTSRQGKMLVATNNREPQGFTVQLEQPYTVKLDLGVGWNKVLLYLESANFRPNEINPENGDQRWLSFALSKINLLTK